MSHTLPSQSSKYAYAPLSPFIVAVGNPDLKADEIYSYEVGYLGEYLDKRLRLDGSLYYMYIRNRTELTTTPGLPVVISYSNANRVIARGVELEAKYMLGSQSFAYANLTRESVTDIAGVREMTETTPNEKVNVGAQAFLGRGFTGTLNAGYKDAYVAKSTLTGTYGRIPDFWRLDARLAYRPRPAYEIFVAGNNLIQARHMEYIDGLAVPRVLYAGFSAKF
jgi:iron complex outermembrane receptor protein